MVLQVVASKSADGETQRYQKGSDVSLHDVQETEESFRAMFLKVMLLLLLLLLVLLLRLLLLVSVLLLLLPLLLLVLRAAVLACCS